MGKEMRLEYYYCGDRWFLYPIDRQDKTDLAYVDDHPFRVDASEIIGPWAEGTNSGRIPDILWHRLQNRINTAIRFRGDEFRVVGWFGYFCGIELMRFSLIPSIHEQGGQDE